MARVKQPEVDTLPPEEDKLHLNLPLSPKLLKHRDHLEHQQGKPCLVLDKMPNKFNHQSLKRPTFKSAEANGATMTDPKNLIARENDRENFGEKVSRVPLLRNTESHSRKSLLQRGTSWPCPNKVSDSAPISTQQLQYFRNLTHDLTQMPTQG